MAKKTKRPAAYDWSEVPCENLLDVGFCPNDADSLSISESTWVAGAVYRSEPYAPTLGYIKSFRNASDCLGWFRWWVLPACCLGEGVDFTPDEVELEGEFARVAEVIDNSEADQAEAILYYLANHIESALESSSHPGVVPPAEKNPFESVLEDLLDVDPLRISCLLPLPELLGRCGTDAAAWENLLGIPVKFSGIRMVLPAKGWEKVKTLILDTLDESDYSVDSLVKPLTTQLNPDLFSGESM